MKTVTDRTSALFVSLALLLGACGSGQTGTGSSNTAGTSAGSNSAIPIGVGLAQTSNVALLGQEGIAGAKIAEKYFNDKGGVDGTPIKLVIQDTGGDEAGTIN